MIKIPDSTVLIAFYQDMAAPEVLYRISITGYKVKIPLSVYGEIKGGKFQKLKGDIDQARVQLFENVDRSEFLKIKNRYPNLGNGEIEVIVWGLNCKTRKEKYYCVLDDKLARKVAKNNGVVFTGTLGLIDYLEERRVISPEEKNDLMAKLNKSKFWIK